MKKIKITSTLLSMAMVLPAVAQEGEKKTAFENDMKITARMQARAGWYGSSVARDRVQQQNAFANIGGSAANVDPADPTKAQRAYPSFDARRIRLGVKGKINKTWEYVVDLKGENMISNGGSALIQEATFGYIVGKPLRLRLGSMKVPFTREQILSSSRLLTIERSVVTNALGNQFDTGFQADGRVLDGMIGYGVGVFNGNGGFANGEKGMRNGSFSSGENDTLMYSGRIQIDPLGQYKDGKAMFSDEMLVSLGAAFIFQETSVSEANPFGTQTKQDFRYTFDASINVAGANIQGGWVHAQAKDQNYQQYGWYANVAYFVMPKFLQVWTRYEQFNANVQNAANTTNGDGSTVDLSVTSYLSFGVNLYPVDKHKVKLQIGYYMGMMKGLESSAPIATNQNYKDLGTKDDWVALNAQISF